MCYTPFKISTLKGVFFVKYVGSKSRIAKYIAPIIQSYIDENNIERFYDVETGGAIL